ncbi:MAG: 5'/3'-nucleotidase SurE [Puniceicoccales bacterium]|jgi:5'-nucleotidase|nr:5'/3'-nucleotidase SurE [Puniceicoccales bacterium]
MKVLLTNDDGIYSAAFQRLVRALVEKKWEVYVSAPATEQSGVGRACALTRSVSVAPFGGLGCTAWAVSGTPLDCVNLALTHLLEGKRPDLVISGINWGVNVSIPVIFSSGTVSGAIEGATFGIPSIAASQCLPGQSGQYIQRKIDFLAHEGLMESIDRAAERTARYAEEVVKTSDNVVHNINFPYPMGADTAEEVTVLSNVMRGEGAEYPVYCSLYERQNGEYHFSIKQDLSVMPPPGTDVDALLRGKISRSIIDLRRLCQRG